MKTQHIIILALVLAIGYLLYIIMIPFWIPFFWAIVLTILFYPLYSWIQKKFYLLDSIASILTCIIIAAFLTVPFSLLAAALVNETVDIYKLAETYIKSSSFQNSLYYYFPHVEKTFNKYIDMTTLDIQGILLKSAQESSTYVIQNLSGIITNFTGFIINMLLSLFAMYYLFKDGKKLVKYVEGVLPLSEKDKKMIFKKNKEVIYATLYGGVSVAVAQGVLGGLAFWLLGLSSPVFWGTIMAVLSFIPMIGAPVIWVPASIYLLIKASYFKALILVILGIFIIGLIDNLLRPLVVSGRTKIHPLLLLFSILGALKVLGFIGIIAGPIIVSLSLVAIDICKASYNQNRRVTDNDTGV